MSNTITQTLLAFAGQEQYLTVPKAFIKFTGSLDCALMLSQLLFWTPAAEKHEGRNKGWIYRSDKEWGEAIYITQYAIRQSRKRLEDFGIIETDVRKANGSPTVHYHVKMERLNELWREYVEHPEVDDPSFDFANWFFCIRKIDLVDSQEPNVEFARTLTEEIDSSDPQSISSPAVALAPSESSVDDGLQPLQQTLGFVIAEPTESVPEPKQKEPRETRKKSRPGFEDAKRAIFDVLPIKYSHGEMGKGANFVLDQAQQNGWDVDDVYNDIVALYANLMTKEFWQHTELHPMALAKQYRFWRANVKPRAAAHAEVGAPATQYKPQPLFVKPQEGRDESERHW